MKTSTSNQTARVLKRLAPLDAVVPRLLRQWGVPGAAIGITDRDRTLFARGYGRCDLDNKRRVTERTAFAVCSCTKAITAVSAGILTDDGAIDWDRPIRDFLPSFRLKDPVLTARLTVRDLLSHRSGVPDHFAAWIFSPATRREFVARLPHLKANKDLRTTYQYNNLFYMLVGHLIEELTGRAWEDFVRERVFRPLGMTTSQFASDAEPLTDDFATGHTTPQLLPSYLFYKGRRESSLAAAFGPIGPAGTVVSSALDMCRWLRIHLNGGEAPGPDGGTVRLISEKNLAEVHKPAIPMTDPFPPPLPEMPTQQQALGMVVSPYRGHRCVYHTGCFGGFKAMQMILPDAGFATAVLLNSDHSFLEMAIQMMINDLVLGLDPINWNRRWCATARAWEKMAAPPAEKPQRGTRPSHPPKDFAGRYENPVYGPAVIEEKQGKLVVRFNQFTLKTRHDHLDVFQTMVDTRGIPYGGFRVQFHTARNGRVDSLSIPFAFMPEEARFRRVK